MKKHESSKFLTQVVKFGELDGYHVKDKKGKRMALYFKGELKALLKRIGTDDFGDPIMKKIMTF